ncbi:MAG: GNAT family protein [Oligoflexia bacterium]|nr:GNAT family protein [Oligoflexia bacterium]
MDNLQINSQLELRQIEQRDCSHFMKLIDKNRIYLREWLGWLDVTKTEDDLGKFINKTLSEIKDNKALCFLIWNQDQIAGIINLRDIDFMNKKAMIGYWVGQEFTGQGFAKKATKILIDHAFKKLSLNRIEIRCATGNTASQAIPKSLSMKSEGILRDNEWLYDHFVDHIVFSAIASQWQ